MSDRHPELPVDPDALQAPAPHRQGGLLLVVASGGAVGAVLRYALALALPAGRGGWPTATFTANLLGAFLLGVLLEGLARLGPDGGRWRIARLGLGTGLLGAFTTYSTLATEAVLLARDGHRALAVAYGGASVLSGYVAAAAGIALSSRAFAGPRSTDPTGTPG